MRCSIRLTSPSTIGPCAAAVPAGLHGQAFPPPLGLAAGVVDAHKTKYCPGAYQLPGQSHRYRCWRRGGHGTVALEQAVVQSCDVYFYNLAHNLVSTA